MSFSISFIQRNLYECPVIYFILEIVSVFQGAVNPLFLRLASPSLKGQLRRTTTVATKPLCHATLDLSGGLRINRG